MYLASLFSIAESNSVILTSSIFCAPCLSKKFEVKVAKLPQSMLASSSPASSFSRVYLNHTNISCIHVLCPFIFQQLLHLYLGNRVAFIQYSNMWPPIPPPTSSKFSHLQPTWRLFLHNVLLLTCSFLHHIRFSWYTEGRRHWLGFRCQSENEYEKEPSLCFNHSQERS